LLFLPPHSPELNPIERVWKNLRYLVTHNTYFENLETLENAVAEYLKDYFNLNKQLASLCCI
jgi:transposase